MNHQTTKKLNHMQILCAILFISSAVFLIGGFVMLGSIFEQQKPKFGDVWIYTDPNPYAFSPTEKRTVIAVSGSYIKYYTADDLSKVAAWNVDSFCNNAVRVQP